MDNHSKYEDFSIWNIEISDIDTNEVIDGCLEGVGKINANSNNESQWMMKVPPKIFITTDWKSRNMFNVKIITKALQDSVDKRKKLLFDSDKLVGECYITSTEEQYGEMNYMDIQPRTPNSQYRISLVVVSYEWKGEMSEQQT